MRSMTGFGKARVRENNIEVDLDIKSINGRFLDLRIYLPRELNYYEHIVRKQCSERLSRGTVDVRITVTDHREPNIKLNPTKLVKYHEIVQQAHEVLGISGEIDMSFLLNEPGIIEIDGRPEDDQELNELLDRALSTAIDSLIESQRKEAISIRDILEKSCRLIQTQLTLVEAEIQPYKEELFSSMKARTTELLGSFTTENLEQRLFQEIALYIDKYDIQEEITRLRSHINTMIESLKRTDEIGKNLNFILQEMQREANTLGSKFSTAKSFTFILSIKEEIEKCREIVQNVA